MGNFSDKQLLYDLFQAYFDARKNKRNTINALAFEVDYERNLFRLYEKIKNRTYEINPGVCFIIFKPVQREVFAADFRDRIVHHLIFNYINPLFERLFIFDSYSCRKGKGTSRGIKRLDHFIRSCSRNYSRDCYALKIDIKGYFMAMDHSILYQKIEKTLQRFSSSVDFDIDLVRWLIRKVVFNDPTKNCFIKGKRENWQGLPETKSLFSAGQNKGLPIGNLTSQLFGNVYLDDFDHFIKNKLGCRHYGRYVDDLVIVHQDKEYLKSLIPRLREYLCNELLLELHRNKIYLQHFSKGINFLGTVIKPYRIYVRNRIKGNFYRKIQCWNNFLASRKNEFGNEIFKTFLASLNSYLGIMKHYNTYKLRKKMLTRILSVDIQNDFSFSNDYAKLTAKI